jgi:hypothetical protein
MKLAIMQPYFFPYIGYFQLMNAVDKFVIYDDVNFINRGWVNRNRILVNSKEHMFTVPLKNASQNVLIKDLELIEPEKWKNKFLKTLEHAYGKAPFFEKVFSIVNKVINTKSKFIKDWHLNSFRLINNYLGINTIIVESSSIYNNQSLKGQDRILDICIKEKTDQYINTMGGKGLYSAELFMNHEIKLNILETKELNYNQFSSEFVPWLSMIDVMMFNKNSSTKDMLSKYKLIK